MLDGTESGIQNGVAGQEMPDQGSAQPQGEPEELLFEDPNLDLGDEFSGLFDDKGNVTVPKGPAAAPAAPQMAPEIQALLATSQQQQQQIQLLMQALVGRQGVSQAAQAQDPFDMFGESQQAAQGQGTPNVKQEVDRLRAEYQQKIAEVEAKMQNSQKEQRIQAWQERLVSEADQAAEWARERLGGSFNINRGTILAMQQQYGGNINARQAAAILAKGVNEDLRRAGAKIVRKPPQRAPGMMPNEAGNNQEFKFPTLKLTGDSDADIDAGLAQYKAALGLD